MRIAPRASANDGLLDLCLLREINPLKLFCLFPTVYFGHHLKMREFEYSTAEQMRLETETPRDIYADGEYVCTTPAEIRAVRGALQLIAPIAV